MSTGIPRIDVSILQELSSQVSKQTFSQASLEAAAAKMKVSVGEFLNALKASTGGAGARGRVVQDAASSIAKQVYSAVGDLPNARELARLQLQAARQVATTAATAGEAAGTVATGGRILGTITRIGSAFGLTGAAATAAGVVTLLGAAGILGAIVGTAAGSFAGDDPVQPGSAIDGPHATQVPVATAGVAEAELYSVWLLTNVSNGSVWVGQESVLQGSMTCQWPGGGLCADAGSVEVPLAYEQKLGPYSTSEEAVSAYCGALASTPVYWPLQHGYKGEIFGASYWVDTAPPCG